MGEKTFYDGQWREKTSAADADPLAALRAALSPGPLIAPPAVVSAWDLDAASMSSPDLAANGWSINYWGEPWTTLTRIGDIGGGLSHGGYRSSLKGGQLWLQLYPGSAGTELVVITKPTDGGAYTYKADVWNSYFGAGRYDGNDNIGWSVIFGGAAPHPSAPGVHLYISGLQNGSYLEFAQSGPTFIPFQNTNVGMTPAFGPNIKYIFAAAAVDGGPQSVRGHHHLRFDGQTMMPPGTGRTLGAAATHFGVAVAASTAEYIYISSIRRAAGQEIFP